MTTVDASRSAPTSARRERADLLLLSLGHTVTDIYSNFLPGLIVFLTLRLGLSNTLVGLLATVVSLSGSMSQILFGVLADRVRQHYFLVVGPIAAAVFMSLLGTAQSLPTLILLLALGGCGVACFHPQAAVAAGSGRSETRGFSLALFVTAGSAGYSLGPIVATWLAETFGLERMWVAFVPGLMMGLALYATVYQHLRTKVIDQRPEAGDQRPETAGGGDGEREDSQTLGQRRRLGDGAAGAIFLLWAIVTLRSAANISLVTFLPLFMKGRGAGAVYGSLAVSLFLLAGTAGGMLGGALSDRWGRRRVLVVSLAASTPLLAALPWVPVSCFVPLLVAAGLVLSASAAVNVAMAQEIAPKRQGTASAMVQGAAFGTGGLLAVAAGALADHTSIAVVCQVVAFLPLLTVPVALALPETVSCGAAGSGTRGDRGAPAR